MAEPFNNLPHEVKITLFEQVAAYAVVPVGDTISAFEAFVELNGCHVLPVNALLAKHYYHGSHAIPVYLSALVGVAGEVEQWRELLVTEYGFPYLAHMGIGGILPDALHIVEHFRERMLLYGRRNEEPSLACCTQEGVGVEVLRTDFP